ncbi:MAG TPA: hypothetical protein VLI67_01195 [Vicinamibacteria bacterium]|nr:hypothetical protein [Vicinamibacteria bacterium]
MSARAVSLALAAFLAAGPLLETGRAQSLGEAAARERRKREKEKAAREAKPPAPVFTNEDLEGERDPSDQAAGSGGETAEAASDAGRESTGAAQGGGPEAYWRQRADGAREAIAQAERAVAEAEARADRLGRDGDPLSGLLDPNRLQTLEAERARARAAVEAARKSLAAARQALEDLEEEARRQSVPPGWLRER